MWLKNLIVNNCLHYFSYLNDNNVLQFTTLHCLDTLLCLLSSTLSNNVHKKMVNFLSSPYLADPTHSYSRELIFTTILHWKRHRRATDFIDRPGVYGVWRLRGGFIAAAQARGRTVILGTGKIPCTDRHWSRRLSSANQ